jgi:hypothetical protein
MLRETNGAAGNPCGSVYGWGRWWVSATTWQVDDQARALVRVWVHIAELR